MFELTIKGATLAELFASAAAVAALSGVQHAPIQPNTGNVGNAAADPDGGPANPNAPAMDSAGLPWDERIHAGNRAQNADGTWRKRRGVDAATVANVEMQLRANQQAAVTQQFNPNASQPQQNFQQQPPNNFNPGFNPNAQPPQNFNPNAGQPQFDPNQQQNFQQFNPNASQPQQNFQQQPPQTPQNVQQTNTAPLDFGGFMNALSTGMQAGRITNEDIGAICQTLQLQNIALLQNDPAKLNQAVDFLRQRGKL